MAMAAASASSSMVFDKVGAVGFSTSKPINSSKTHASKSLYRSSFLSRGPMVKYGQGHTDAKVQHKRESINGTPGGYTEYTLQGSRNNVTPKYGVCDLSLAIMPAPIHKEAEGVENELFCSLVLLGTFTTPYFPWGSQSLRLVLKCPKVLVTDDDAFFSFLHLRVALSIILGISCDYAYLNNKMHCTHIGVPFFCLLAIPSIPLYLVLKDGSVILIHEGFTRALTGDDNGKPTGISPLIVCFGEMLIDFVPTVSGVSLAEAPAFKKAPGGAPANVAVGIARLGGSSAFVGKVGEDEFGYMLAEIMKENNVDHTGMRFDPGARTALAFVTLRADGEREFMFFRNPSADMLLHESELEADLIKRAKIFHYGSISLIAEPCKTAHLTAMKIAKDAGSVLSYDPNLRLPLWPSANAARDGILSIWDKADIIKVSEEEITFLTEGQDPYDDTVVRKLFHPNLKLLLVTEGQDGCRYYTKDFNGRVNGLKVQAVDTTGAGDAFVSGILSQLASDLTLHQDEQRLREALHFANACGAITVTERGAIPALPTLQDVLEALPKVFV
eukprot:Gb_27281 [translate_table: standard]